MLFSLAFWCVFSYRREWNGAAAVMVGILHNLQSAWFYLESQWKWYILVICGSMCLISMNVFEAGLLESGFTHTSVLCKGMWCHVHLDGSKMLRPETREYGFASQICRLNKSWNIQEATSGVISKYLMKPVLKHLPGAMPEILWSII